MATTALLNTKTEDLKELLGNGKSYSVPQYQRDYSWKSEHWEDLWEDLLNIEKTGEDHYMGALVLESGERKRYRVIDGQQRLTTLSILILACVDFLEDLAKNGIDTTANKERASLFENNYLGAKDPASLRTIPKLTLNANDGNFYQLNLAQRKPPQGGLRILRDSERLLWDCFEFFRKKIRERFSTEKSSGQATARFVNEVVAEKLIFITVQVQDQLSAYTVFETLNARGLELTETDLLKNYLLSLAERINQSQLDFVVKQWARITERVGIAAFPEFLRHHLNSQREYVRQKQLFKTIKKEVTKLEQVFPLLDKLEEDAAWFAALNDSSNEFWLDYPDANEHVRVLNLFNVSQFTPFMLAAKDKFKQARDIAELLRYCAVISVRFNGVGKRSTNTLEEAYNKAALKIRDGSSSSLVLIRESLKSIYIPDNEFENDFAALRLPNRGIPGKRLRYLLSRLERQLKPSDVSDENMQATVEHILPENLAATGWDQFTPEAHERCVDRVGNYSLLERKLNQRLAGNAAFSDKKNVYAQSQYRTSLELVEYSEWTETTIAARQLRLAKVAKSIWSLPQ